MYLLLFSDLFQQASFHSSLSHVHEQLQLGWGLALECCFRLKPDLGGKFTRVELDKKKLGICSFKGMHIHIKISI